MILLLLSPLHSGSSKVLQQLCINFLCMGLDGFGFMGLGVQEWADSALFTISICILSGSTI